MFEIRNSDIRVDSMLSFKISEKFLSELRDIFHHDLRIILFGSYAKGTAQTYSDVVPLRIENKKFNLAVYHAQQVVEKLLKACLAAEGKIGIYKHEIFTFFLNAFNEKIDTNLRYPDWSIEPIWVPSEQYTIDNTIMSETKMHTVFEILVPFWKKNYQIKV